MGQQKYHDVIFLEVALMKCGYKKSQKTCWRLYFLDLLIFVTALQHMIFRRYMSKLTTTKIENLRIDSLFLLKEEKITKISVYFSLVKISLTVSQTIVNVIIDINRTRSFKCKVFLSTAYLSSLVD